MSETEKLLQESLRQNAELLKRQNEFIKEIKQLNEQVAYLTNKLYGRHSEKISENEAQKVRKRHRTRSEIISKELPIEETIIMREKDCCEHGHQLVSVGKHFIRQVVHQIPGKLFVENIYEQTYKCIACENLDGCSHLYHGKAPQALIAHSIATPFTDGRDTQSKIRIGNTTVSATKGMAACGHFTQ